MPSDLDVGMKCIKYMLFASNFMFVMIGFLLISIGSSIRAIYDDFELFMESHYFSPALLLVSIGVIIFFVALFGCLGAIRESTMLVNIYSLFLLLILILEISVAFAAYAMRKDIAENVEVNMRNVMAAYDEDSGEIPTVAMDFLQSRLQCCGLDSYRDWIDESVENTAYNGTWSVPASCYYYLDSSQIYETGCLRRLSYVVSECAMLLGSGAICVAFVQLLGVIFAHMLAKAIRRLKTENERERQEANQRFYAQLALEKEVEKPSQKLYTPTPEKIPIS